MPIHSLSNPLRFVLAISTLCLLPGCFLDLPKRPIPESQARPELSLRLEISRTEASPGDRVVATAYIKNTGNVPVRYSTCCWIAHPALKVLDSNGGRVRVIRTGLARPLCPCSGAELSPDEELVNALAFDGRVWVGDEHVEVGSKSPRIRGF